jgi:sortase A
MKTLRVALTLMVLLGTCLTSRAAYLRVKAEAAGYLIRRAWDQSVRTGKPSSPWPWADTHPVARLKIPRLGYDEIVLEGASARTLAFGPARLLSSAQPGEPGNLAVAGHRTSWFRRLEEIRAGDEIEVQWYDSRSHSLHERDFKVDFIHIVKPDDVELLAPTADDALTLITCFPFGPSPRSPQRYVVRAIPSDARLASK